VLAEEPDATFFHGRTWARIVCASFPGVSDASIWIDVDDQPVLVPAFDQKRALGLLVTRQSSYPFHYGGPAPTRDRAGRPLWSLAFAHLQSSGVSVRVTGNPFAPSLETEIATPPGFHCSEDSTHLLELPATVDAYWRQHLTTAQRNDVRRLSKKGLLIEETRASSDVDAVYELYLGSFARWGGVPPFAHPRAYYHSLVEVGGPAVRFTVARVEGRVVGGNFTIRWRDRAHYLAGYSDHEARSFRPNVLLQVDSISRAITDGCVWYDFLPSGPGHDTVAQFKEGMGGVRRALPVWESTSRIRGLVNLLRRRRGGGG